MNELGNKLRSSFHTIEALIYFISVLAAAQVGLWLHLEPASATAGGAHS